MTHVGTAADIDAAVAELLGRTRPLLPESIAITHVVACYTPHHCAHCHSRIHSAKRSGTRARSSHGCDQAVRYAPDA